MDTKTNNQTDTQIGDTVIKSNQKIKGHKTKKYYFEEDNLLSYLFMGIKKEKCICEDVGVSQR